MRRFVLLMLISGCGSTIITDEGLSRACSVDSDCVTVFLGDVCSYCSCVNSAIAVSSKATYDGEVAAGKFWCDPRRPLLYCECEESHAQCVAGACARVVP